MSSISFGFTKAKSSASIAQQLDAFHQEAEQAEAASALDEFDGKAKEEPKAPELVIPLQRTNEWRAPDPEALKSVSIDQEVIEELRRKAMNPDGMLRPEPAAQELDAIPILMQNRPPKLELVTDEAEKLKMDVAQRPDEASLDDYERVPIQLIGEALLRGMGWRKGEAIGGKNKALMEPIEYVRRPERQGLGAQRNAELAPPKPQKARIKPGESREPKKEMVAPMGQDGKVRHYKTIDEKLVEREVVGIFKGKGALILSGPHEGFKARITETKLDTVRVRLDINGSDVTVPRDDLKPLSEADYAALDAHRAPTQPVREKAARSDDGGEYAPKRKPERSWLNKSIRARITSNKYKGGKYYNAKVVITDVTRPGYCNAITPDGKILEDLTDRDVETIIPKELNSRVMVVRGPHCSQIGKMVERYPDDSTAAVQLNTQSEAVLLSYDDISEFVGEQVMDDY